MKTLPFTLSLVLIFLTSAFGQNPNSPVDIEADVAKSPEYQAAKAAELTAAQALAKAKATAEFQADAAKSIELQDRRKKAEAEAAGIRAMMNAPKRKH